MLPRGCIAIPETSACSDQTLCHASKCCHFKRSNEISFTFECMPLQAAASSGVGSKPALPEDLFSMDPVPMQAPPAAPAQQPGMMIEQVLQQRHLQQQQLLGQPAQQQQFGGPLVPGMAPQGGFLGQQPLPTQQQQQYFQSQAPQQQQQYFMQPQQAQPAFGAMQTAAANGSGLQGPQPGQPALGGAAAQGRTLSGKPLAQSGAPDPFAGLGF